MALQGLLHDLHVSVEHDERQTGTFTNLAGPLSLAMLCHFSSTIASSYSYDRTQFHNQAGSYRYPQAANANVRIVGGNSDAHRDLFNWMRHCCERNRIVQLEQVPMVRRLQIAEAIRIQSIGQLINSELPSQLRKLTEELLSHQEHAEILGLHSVLPEMRNAIVQNITRNYCQGSLPTLEAYFHLASAYPSFDQELQQCLRQLANTGMYQNIAAAEQAWISKSMPRYDTYRRLQYPQNYQQNYQQNYSQNSSQGYPQTYPQSYQHYSQGHPQSYHQNHQYPQQLYYPNPISAAGPHAFDDGRHIHFNNDPYYETRPPVAILHPTNHDSRTCDHRSPSYHRHPRHYADSCNIPHRNFRDSRPSRDPEVELALPGETHSIEYGLGGVVNHIFDADTGRRRVVAKTADGLRLESSTGPNIGLRRQGGHDYGAGGRYRTGYGGGWRGRESGRFGFGMDGSRERMPARVQVAVDNGRGGEYDLKGESGTVLS